jgi:ELWxxDGT repeat protein
VVAAGLAAGIGLVLILAFPAAGESATYLVRDIQPGSSGSDPQELERVNGMLFFSADDGANGRGLWKSDATPEGTVLVKEIWPADLTNVDGVLYFGRGGGELWKSDGTEAGTVLVKDIRPDDPNGSGPEDFVALNGVVLFRADDGTHGYELWKSDGTEQGTELVKDIRDIPLPGSSSNPTDLNNVNGTVFFTADEGIHGPELWRSDGTEQGTMLVKDIWPGLDGSEEGEHAVTDVNGIIFLSANDGMHGKELWKSDGTEAGTVLLKDIWPGSMGSPSSFVAHETRRVGGTLFFGADDGTVGGELWKTDGTEPGTVLVKDIRPGPIGSNPEQLERVNGTLFFSADDGVNGRELWRSDGTEAGTLLVKDIWPGAGSSSPEPTDVDGLLYFTADDGRAGRELWRSDGTPGGTLLAADIRPGPPGSFPFLGTNVNGTLFFSAEDGAHGRELWATTPDQPACFGDLNQDGIVNNADALRFRGPGCFPCSEGCNRDCDSNGDGVVNNLDVLAFRGNFGRPCP